MKEHLTASALLWGDNIRWSSRYAVAERYGVNRDYSWTVLYNLFRVPPDLRLPNGMVLTEKLLLPCTAVTLKVRPGASAAWVMIADNDMH